MKPKLCTSLLTKVDILNRNIKAFRGNVFLFRGISLALYKETDIDLIHERTSFFLADVYLSAING